MRILLGRMCALAAEQDLPAHDVIRSEMGGRGRKWRVVHLMLRKLRGCLDSRSEPALPATSELPNIAVVVLVAPTAIGLRICAVSCFGVTALGNNPAGIW